MRTSARSATKAVVGRVGGGGVHLWRARILARSSAERARPGRNVLPDAFVLMFSPLNIEATGSGEATWVESAATG